MMFFGDSESNVDRAREALSRANSRVIRAEHELAAAVAARDQAETHLTQVDHGDG